jgi:hypothetical protein
LVGTIVSYPLLKSAISGNKLPAKCEASSIVTWAKWILQKDASAFPARKRTGAPGATTASVQAAKRLRKRVTIRTEKREICRRDILPIAIDVLDFKRNVAADWVPFVPIATLTVLAQQF